MSKKEVQLQSRESEDAAGFHQESKNPLPPIRSAGNLGNATVQVETSTNSNWSRPQISFWRFEDKKMGEGKGEEEMRSGKVRIELSADWLFHNGRESSMRVLFLSVAVPKTRQRSFIEPKTN